MLGGISSSGQQAFPQCWSSWPLGVTSGGGQQAFPSAGPTGLKGAVSGNRRSLVMVLLASRGLSSSWGGGLVAVGSRRSLVLVLLGVVEPLRTGAIRVGFQDGRMYWMRTELLIVRATGHYNMIFLKRQTCAGNCGSKLETCSCHPTCISLKNCCSNYREYCVEISPYSGSIFGGTDFVVVDASFNQSSQIVCRFNDDIRTVGYVDESGRAHCISPLLYETGWVPLQISSDNGTTFSRTGEWLSVHTGKLDPQFKATLLNATKWQYYGTPNVGGSLEMTWNTSLIRATKVNIELWGYRESGESYTQHWQAKWEYLYSLARDQLNNGTFSFLPKPAENGFSEWELGCIRISSSTYPDGMWNVQAVWSEDHALAWHLEEQFRQDSAAWALEKCQAWDQLESRLPNFLSEVIDCPCTLSQARADTGRFHTDYGCDIEKGSVCTYHPGSVHCVRAIHASPRYGAGQQCCYDRTGAQVLTADSIGGSTPDRAHDWGSPPYKKPPRVPGESHWVYDVLSFYYCCLWSDNCHFYFKHRPSTGCRKYLSPKPAVVFGDPHFITFDGVSYSFNGKGEYSLVTSMSKELTVQGRTEPLTLLNGTKVKAAKLSAVAMREGSSDIIEVRLGSSQDYLEVLRNHKTLFFTEQSWMDLKGVFVFSPSHKNVTVMFPTGAGVEVRLREGTMMTTVLLPEQFNGSTLGLLGIMNGRIEDDLVASDGQPVSNQSNPQELFRFGGSWAISNESSLFTYDSEYLLDTYLHAPKHDPDFVPVFSVPDNPDDPLANQASVICSGEGSLFCRYDILVGRSSKLGNATRVSFQSHVSLVEDLKPVVSCGWLSPPQNGKKEGTTYLQGAMVRLSCNDGYILQGSEERMCQKNGQWSGITTSCEAAGNVTGIVVGSVIGGLTLIIMITAIILHSRKQKRKATQPDGNEAGEAL
ncbi:sushi domain-containing protein 2-like [Lampris incognitus]|uniref:sushi domain-containing protein 2-like n=1 Tax=Lampris incognitus TaxID=2546036 RepID=UPI0024B57CFA|nr:sushi domain-containing protein 2-like [Lampris incognitus]